MLSLIDKCKTKQINLFEIFDNQLARIVKGNVNKFDCSIEEDDKLIEIKIMTPFNPLDFSKEESKQKSS